MLKFIEENNIQGKHKIRLLTHLVEGDIFKNYPIQSKKHCAKQIADEKKALNDEISNLKTRLDNLERLLVSSEGNKTV